MNKVIIVLIAASLVVVAGVSLFLATWDFPPPVSRVEKTIPDDRFRR